MFFFFFFLMCIALPALTSINIFSCWPIIQILFNNHDPGDLHRKQGSFFTGIQRRNGQSWIIIYSYYILSMWYGHCANCFAKGHLWTESQALGNVGRAVFGEFWSWWKRGLKSCHFAAGAPVPRPSSQGLPEDPAGGNAHGALNSCLSCRLDVTEG